MPFLGAIPADWEVRPAVTLAQVLASTIDKHSVDGEKPVRLCNYTDVYYNDVIRPHSKYMSATATSEQLAVYSVRAGDVAFTKDSESADDIGIAAYVEETLPGVVYGYHLSIYRPRDRRYGKFLKWLLDSRYVKANFETRTFGVTRVGLSQNTVRYLRVPTPPPEQAVLIAEYLDRETAEIDAFIADQEKLIELLTERRAATITHAVTQGVDFVAPKGFQWSRWFGTVPSGWEEHSLRRSTRFLTSGSRGWAEFFAAEGDRFIRIGNLSRMSLEVDLSDLQHVALPQGIEGRRTMTEPGDVLFSITAYLGSVGLIDATSAGSYVSQHVALVRLDPQHFVPRYLGYLAMSDPLQSQLVSNGYGGTKQQLSLGDLGNLKVLRPRLSEQKAIVDYLDGEMFEIEAAMTDAREATALLRERRAALISAAVTGKIDVREHAISASGHSEVA